MPSTIEAGLEIAQSAANKRATEDPTTGHLAAAAGVALARYIYSRLNSLEPYSKADMIRYKHLIDTYKKELQATKVPDEWALGDLGIERSEDLQSKCGRPLYAHDFENSGLKLQEEVEQCQIAEQRIQSIARIMLIRIISLFSSVSKRTRGKIRPGSIEGMIFSELAHWITRKLPGLDFNSENSLLELKKMHTYCSVVDADILLPDGSHERNTPRYTMRLIIEHLDSMIIETSELIKEKTFIEHLKDLDATLSEQLRAMLNMAYFLIQGDHGVDSALDVALFMDRQGINIERIALLKQTNLGRLLAGTLEILDLTSNQMRAKKLLSLKTIQAHLSSMDETILEKGKKIDPKRFGVWSFLTFGIEDEESLQKELKEFVSDIKELHYAILKTYHLMYLVRKTYETSPIHGSLWRYRDKIGQAIFNTLCAMAVAFSSQSEAIASKVMARIANKLKAQGDTSINERQLLLQTQGHRYLRNAKKKLNQQLGIGLKKIELIQGDKTLFDAQLNLGEENKALLLRCMADYLESQQSKFPAQYAEIQEALLLLPTSSNDIEPTFKPQALGAQLHKLFFTKSDLPLYHAAEHLFAGLFGKDLPGHKLPQRALDILNTIKKDQLIARPKKFMSPLHRQVYDRFLIGMNIWVNHWNKIFWLIGLTPAKNRTMIQMYEAVNQFMAYLYHSQNENMTTPFSFLDRMMVDRMLEEVMDIYRSSCCHLFFSSFTWPERTTQPIITHSVNETGELVILEVNPQAEKAFSDTYMQLFNKHIAITEELARMKDTLAERDAHIAEQERLLSERDATLDREKQEKEALRQSKNESDARAAESDARAAESDARAAESNARAAEAATLVSHLEEQLRQAKEILERQSRINTQSSEPQRSPLVSIGLYSAAPGSTNPSAISGAVPGATP